MRPLDIDIGLLRCFKAVAKNGGFTVAGLELGLTQSAVSLKIKRLEQLVGKRVFDRNSRGLALTLDGQALLAYAEHLLRLNDQMIWRLRAPPTRGHLSVGIANEFEPLCLQSLLARFASGHRDTRIEVRSGTYGVLQCEYEQERLDVIIAARGAGNIDGTLICTEPLVWAAASGQAAGTNRGGQGDGHASLTDVVMDRHDSLLHERAATLLRDHNIPYTVAYTSTSTPGVIAAVELGIGTALLGRSMLSSSLREVQGLPMPGEVDLVAFWNERSKPLPERLVQFIRRNLAAALRDPSEHAAGARCDAPRARRPTHVAGVNKKYGHGQSVGGPKQWVRQTLRDKPDDPPTTLIGS
jgi:DNA-binding transcriptional LysR family regulator